MNNKHYLLFSAVHQNGRICDFLKAGEDKFYIREHKIGIGTGLFIPGESKTVVNTLVRLEFLLLGAGKTKIYYCVNEDGEIIHKAFVFPRCFKFPFLEKNDFCIGGPCVTEPSYRGRGIYPMMLQHIMNSCGADGSLFYMIVDQANTPSIRGVQKAGFTQVGRATVNRRKQFKRI